MEYIFLIVILFSIISSVVKAKKKREQAQKRMQEQTRRRESVGEGTSEWQSAKPTVQAYVQPYDQPYVQPYTRATGEEGTSNEYAEASVQAPVETRMQAPVQSRNQAPMSSQMLAPASSRNLSPIGSQMQSRMGTQMQTEGRSNNAPRSTARPVTNPFGLFGDLMSEIETQLNGAKSREDQTARPETPFNSMREPEGASEWNSTMQSGSMPMSQSVTEGDSDDIAHYHSRVENSGSMIPASSITSMSSSMLDNATTMTSTSAAAVLSPSATKGSMRFSKNDMRRAVIWTEILKRPQYGVPARKR